MKPALRWFVMAVCVVAALLGWWILTDDGVALRRDVALVSGKGISGLDLAGNLRSELWRRGEAWEALDGEARTVRREQALENLIDRRLIADAFPEGAGDRPPRLRRESEDEFQQFLKQFPPPDEWKERMAIQGLSEAALRRGISEEVVRLDALEQWLAEQPGRITEAEARAWFEAHRSRLVIPERVRAAHIFLTRHDGDKPDREPEIRELRRRLLSGEATFEQLAAASSEDESTKARGGDLGWFTRERVPADFADRAFSEAVGGITAPFQSRLGWHILLVKERKPPRAAAFGEVRAEVIAMLEEGWRDAALRRLVGELRSKADIRRFADRIAAVRPG